MKFLKALFFTVLVLFCSSTAWAVDLAWDHDTPAIVTGYTIYYAPTDGSLGPFNITVADGATMTVTIPESHFQPNLEFTIYATAYNLSGNSEASNSITYTRTGWGPPVDLPPVTLWFKPGKPTNCREQ